MDELNISIMAGDFDTVDRQLVDFIESPLERLAHVMATTAQTYNDPTRADLNGADAQELAAYLEAFSAQAEAIRSTVAALQRYLDRAEMQRTKGD